MTRRRLEFHPAAVDDVDTAFQWYLRHSVAAAGAFLYELDGAFKQVQEHPERWPTHMGQTRRYLLRRFPFLVIYRIQADAIQIIAIAHGRRRPAFWRKR